jgi:hypothetical protein
VTRTWAIWIGIGDYASNQLDIVGYQQASVGVYSDVTMPSMTGQPYMESVVYVDKHQQVRSLRWVQFFVLRAFTHMFEAWDC